MQQPRHDGASDPFAESDHPLAPDGALCELCSALCSDLGVHDLLHLRGPGPGSEDPERAPRV